jgi:hypothetical protein
MVKKTFLGIGGLQGGTLVWGGIGTGRHRLEEFPVDV